MNDLPMPSDVKKEAAALAEHAPGESKTTVIEPPSAKLIVRLFLVPMLIVAAAVGVMFLIGLLTGGSMTLAQAFEELKKPGGERTAGMLIGPGSKQRYQAAKVVGDHVVERLQAGMGEAERIELTGKLLEVVDKAQPHEGTVKPILLRTLAMTWAVDPRQPGMDSPDAVRSRRAVVEKLVSLMQAATPGGATEQERHEIAREHAQVRSAAIFALGVMKGRAEAREPLGKVIDKLDDASETLDVRIAAASTLGKLAEPKSGDAQDQRAIAALERAMGTTKAEDVELVWNAALALAQLNQPQAADTILMLLTRSELDQRQVYDRETDWKNPIFRPLNEPEKQRILINAMQGAVRLEEPRVQAKIREVVQNDPANRVREAGREVLRAAGKE